MTTGQHGLLKRTDTFRSQPPPAGRAVQGRSWPEHLRIEQGQKEHKGGSPGGDPSKGSRHQTYIADLAQSGATCNNYFFPRQPVNDVGEQIKLLQNKYNGTATQQVQPPVDSDTDVALIFIGTNDVSFCTYMVRVELLHTI